MCLLLFCFGCLGFVCLLFFFSFILCLVCFLPVAGERHVQLLTLTAPGKCVVLGSFDCLFDPTFLAEFGIAWNMI